MVMTDVVKVQVKSRDSFLTSAAGGVEIRAPSCRVLWTSGTRRKVRRMSPLRSPGRSTPEKDWILESHQSKQWFPHMGRFDWSGPSLIKL